MCLHGKGKRTKRTGVRTTRHKWHPDSELHATGQHDTRAFHAVRCRWQPNEKKKQATGNRPRVNGPVLSEKMWDIWPSSSFRSMVRTCMGYCPDSPWVARITAASLEEQHQPHTTSAEMMMMMVMMMAPVTAPPTALTTTLPVLDGATGTATDLCFGESARWWVARTTRPRTLTCPPSSMINRAPLPPTPPHPVPMWRPGRISGTAPQQGVPAPSPRHLQHAWRLWPWWHGSPHLWRARAGTHKSACSLRKATLVVAPAVPPLSQVVQVGLLERVV